MFLLFLFTFLKYFLSLSVGASKERDHLWWCISFYIKEKINFLFFIFLFPFHFFLFFLFFLFFSRLFILYFVIHFFSYIYHKLFPIRISVRIAKWVAAAIGSARASTVIIVLTHFAVTRWIFFFLTLFLLLFLFNTAALDNRFFD